MSFPSNYPNSSPTMKFTSESYGIPMFILMGAFACPFFILLLMIQMAMSLQVSIGHLCIRAPCWENVGWLKIFFGRVYAYNYIFLGCNNEVNWLLDSCHLDDGRSFSCFMIV
uniref:uncharacterized protein LOC101315366 n=1 Tax=Fragaria vesca subsp. vesca TaxID=101020 RepID=UPI0005C827C3|nr:PREDICTED: uncharacterized protein LOC101315366 [Fragaria vesca subsp. vesca]